MRHINGVYTTWHNRFGHLFQCRYKAILVDADAYAGELSRYIHLNPCRAGMIRLPEEYQWSSYAGYSGKAKSPGWLTTDWLLRYFGQQPAAARKAYVFFVEAVMDTEQEDPLKEATSTLILGKPAFIDNIREKYLGDKKKGHDIPALKERMELEMNEHGKLGRRVERIWKAVGLCNV
jgi:putative transposase